MRTTIRRHPLDPCHSMGIVSYTELLKKYKIPIHWAIYDKKINDYHELKENEKDLYNRKIVMIPVEYEYSDKLDLLRKDCAISMCNLFLDINGFSIKELYDITFYISDPYPNMDKGYNTSFDYPELPITNQRNYLHSFTNKDLTLIDLEDLVTPLYCRSDYPFQNKTLFWDLISHYSFTMKDNNETTLVLMENWFKPIDLEYLDDDISNDDVSNRERELIREFNDSECFDITRAEKILDYCNSIEEFNKLFNEAYGNTTKVFFRRVDGKIYLS